jgi:hypothetical protein
LSELPDKYDLLIIDGPVGNNRSNFLHFMSFFKTNIPYVIDDTNRGGDREMAIKISKILNKEINEIEGWQKNMMILT